MSIKLDLEDTISFERPLTRVVKQNVCIQNPNDKAIAFKVKTTAPKLYCVRPNSEVIPPHGSIDVQIMLQAQREEPPLDVKCRDKFLILSTFVNEKTENLGITDLWAYVEENDKRNIHQHKLRCVYVQSGANADSTAKSNPTTTAPVAAPAPAPATPVAAPAARSVSENKSHSSAQPNTNENQQQDAIEKMKKMEEELNKYKKEVEHLREAEPVVVEKMEVKSGFPPSIYILISLMIAAIAYFINTK